MARITDSKVKTTAALPHVASTFQRVKEQAENDLVSFIRLVHPQRFLAPIHEEVIRWWTRQDSMSHQLLLLPRDHMKSALVAYRVAWEITRNPTVRVLYISSTANLATKQLKFIKDILTSDIYRRYWPTMVEFDETKREKWTESEISVDHPLRKKEAVRDPTVFTAGLTTGIVGLHCDIAVMDDVVTAQNAYTDEGRTKVEQQYSLLASIQGADGVEWTVGTRYHPLDLYKKLSETQVDAYNDNGEWVGTRPLYESFERQVEDVGDGSGAFIWPRMQRHDGKWFGFDQNILATKRAQYIDKLQFRAQYYNDPNDLSNSVISRDMFQYYDPKHIHRDNGRWFFKDRVLNVFAAIDFAFSVRQKADFTAIVVVGVDWEGNYYVLDVFRFKTDRISEYFTQILNAYNKWQFRKIRAEIVSAQKIIVQDLKDNYIRPYGLLLTVEESAPNRHMGSKEERMEATLQPRYANGQIWHQRGGNWVTLEEELVAQNPPHDDIKDCLTSAIEICVRPSERGGSFRSQATTLDNVFHPRFGGVSR